MKHLNLLFLSVFVFSSCTQAGETESNAPNDAIAEQCENLLIDREPSSLTTVDAKKVAMMFVGGDNQARTAMPVSEILELNDGWYRTSVYIASENKSYAYNQKVLTIEK